MKILLTAILLAMAMVVPVMALELGPSETLYTNGDEFSVKQTDSNGYDWIFAYVKTASSIYNVAEALTGKSCNVLAVPELSKEVLICQ